MKDINEIEKENELDLKEMAHFYGGWDELRKIIEKLEYNEKESDFERYYSDLNR